MDIKLAGHRSMTMSLVASAMLAMTGATLASPSSSPQADELGPDSVILRMETVGGFAPLPVLLLRVPTFTLYADGRAIFQPLDAPLMRVHLDQQRTDDLIRFALQEGGLADARSEYTLSGIADATTTVFTLALDDVRKRVSVYALGIDARGPDRAAYEAFERLAGTLADLGSWLPDGSDIAPYEPTAYLGIFAAEDPERPGLIDWPWDDLVPEDLRIVVEAPFYRTVVMTADQVAALAPIPSREDALAFVASPDGSAYRVMIRPLLPDELPADEADDQA